MTPTQELAFVIVDSAQIGEKCVITREEQNRRIADPTRSATMVAVGYSASQQQPKVYLTMAEHKLVQAFAEYFLTNVPSKDIQTAPKETQTECNDEVIATASKKTQTEHNYEVIALTDEQEFHAVQLVIATHGQHVQDTAQLDATLQYGPTFGSADFTDAIAHELLAMQDMQK